MKINTYEVALSVIGLVPIIITEVANTNILNASRMLSVLAEGTPKFELTKMMLEEAIDLRLGVGQVWLILSALAWSYQIRKFILQHSENKQQGMARAITFSVVMVGGAITLEVLLHTVFMEEVRNGLVRDHALFRYC